MYSLIYLMNVPDNLEAHTLLLLNWAKVTLFPAPDVPSPSLFLCNRQKRALHGSVASTAALLVVRFASKKVLYNCRLDLGMNDAMIQY